MRALAIPALIGTAALPAHGGWDAKLSQKVQATIQAFKQKDPGMKVFLDRAYGCAVFPTIIKGGMGVGGAHGKGQVLERGRVVGTARVSQGTIGFQLGGQSYSQIVFFQNQQALARFKNGNLKLAADATAIALTTGVGAKADDERGAAVFVLPKKGLMYEAVIGGQHFSFTPN